MIMFYIGNMYCTPNKQKKIIHILMTQVSVSVSLNLTAYKYEQKIKPHRANIQYWSEFCVFVGICFCTFCELIFFCCNIFVMYHHTHAKK